MESKSQKSLVSIDNLSKEDIKTLYSLTTNYLECLRSRTDFHHTLKGKSVAILFFEDSTRTRISFELAVKRLGAEVINFSANASSLKKGETLNDTLQNLLMMKVDLIVVRHQHSGTARFFAKKTSVPVINAGDGTNEHPTQALLDLFTMYQNGYTDESLLIELRGDILHSRVAGSALKLWKKLNISFDCQSPETTSRNFLTESRMNDGKNKRHNLIYNLRIQKERQFKELIPGLTEYHEFFGLKGKDIPEKIQVMHPGPINRGVEMDTEAADHSQSLVLQQVEMGVALRMACMTFLLN